MNESRRRPAVSSRRNVLKGLGAVTASASLGAMFLPDGAVADEPAAPTPGPPPAAETGGPAPHQHQVSGIDPKHIVDEYERRDLDGLSDANLCQQVAAIFASPPAKGFSSFSLHAPLELMARAGLMPLVDPRQRALARLQLVASAAKFETETTPVAPPPKIKAFPDPQTAQGEFLGAFKKGDAGGLEAIVLQYASQFGTASLVHLLTPLALPTMTGASHSHIGLWLLLRHARTSDIADASLLRAAARALAGGAGSQLKSFGGMHIEGTERLAQAPADVEREVLDKLANPPKGKLGGTGMFGLISGGEATGNADTLFGDFIRHDLTDEQIDAAFRAVLRACAHNMLQHDPTHAKFGWSHCLTLPQAACGLSSLNMQRKLALAASLVWIIAYRSTLSDRALDFGWQPEKLQGSVSLAEALATSPNAAASRVWYADPAELAAIKQTLATEAAIRGDQHLVKYTRAALDMVSFDPTHEQLYLAAAAHLCGVWVKERPEKSIRDSFYRDRNR